MSHKISNVVIKNYRSCIETELKLSSFTPLVGYNNAGKSNAIAGIHWLLKKSSLPAKDFFDENQPVEVIATIEGVASNLLALMPQRQRASIEGFVFDGKLKIRRIQERPNARATDITISVWNEGEQKWAVNPNGIDNSLKALLPEPIRIGAMENAAEDATKAKTTTTIGKLLSEFLEPVKLAHEQELNNHLGEVSRRISSDGDMRFGELGTIDESVNSKINDLFPGMSIKLHFDTPTFDDLIKSGTIKVYENLNEGRDFSSYGHGAQRAIQMALIQHLAEVKRDNGAQASTTLLLIDEPELYLHPFAIEQVRQALIALSSSGYQIVLSTHSAQMITPEHAETALLIRKDSQRGTYTRDRLSDAIHRVVPNANHQIEQLFNLSHSTQVLFAENVVLTEGKTELRLLPFLFENVAGLTMGQEKHALVAQSGVNDTKKSLEILKAMDLPSKAIADLDYGLGGAVRDGFLDVTDPDVIALKSIFQTFEQQSKVKLNGNGLPQNGVVTAAAAFELLASEATAIPHIENLHNKMKIKGIWLWKKGAIEAHIGTTSKDEREWARFKRAVNLNGLQAICTEYQSVVDLVAWIRN
jgi:putative ATP-dependent endonuclease of OLD family